ncbi:MAG: acyl-CoA carboxylase subunit beta [Caldisericia bacterium]|nr:acyl-CoA carboxylase subunit beta [Caldisericia bacterium]
MWIQKAIEELKKRIELAHIGGGKEKINKQHLKGKLTARERIDILLDSGTFNEIGSFVKSKDPGFGKQLDESLGDGVVTGYGNINGVLVYVFSQDFTVIGGSLGESHALKICRLMDMALDNKAPIISINDSGGARIEEGVHSLSGYSEIFLRNTLASGVIPQIAVILGSSAGGACYSPGICDFIFMTEHTSHMFITGPRVVKTVTGVSSSLDDLGGSNVHTKRSGVAHFAYANDEECLQGVKDLLSYLPKNYTQKPPEKKVKLSVASHGLDEIVPDNQKKVYDIKKVIEKVSDKDSFLEVHKNYALNMVVGFARMDGKVLGIVANQPNCLSGAIDINASDKAARFVRTCDCFNIPILTLVDVTGFLPGIDQEQDGIIRHGAKLLYAFSEATVPKVSLILRKAYGGAYIAMNSKKLGADIVYAWPIAQIAVMGAEGAVDIIFRKEIGKSEDPIAKRNQYIENYRERFMNPYVASENGYVDEVIPPEVTRKKLIDAFEMLKDKDISIPGKKHGNIPL